MCYGCAVEIVCDIDLSEDDPPVKIPWPTITEEMRLCAILVENLYELPHGGTGGPLHIAVDDYNIDAMSLAFCRNEVEGGDTDGWYGESWGALAEVSLRILNLMDEMSEPERATMLALRDDFIKEGA
jgi:hypothetical protein